MAKTEFLKDFNQKRVKLRVASDGLLADQEALNLGSFFEVVAAPEGSQGLLKFGMPVRILNIEGEDADSETVLLTFEQGVTLLEPTQDPVPGPIIGIVEFGTGSGVARLEFDVPSPVGGPAPNAAAVGSLAGLFTPSKSNSITLVVPASSVRCFARNDAQTGFLTNFSNTNVNGVEASRATPARVRVHAAYGHANMIKQCVTRTYYVCGNNAGVAASLDPGDNINIGIPPFAKRVSFPRLNANNQQPVDIFFQDYYSSGISVQFTIPAGEIGPLEIPPHTGGVFIRNPSTNLNSFTHLQAIFELGF